MHLLSRVDVSLKGSVGVVQNFIFLLKVVLNFLEGSEFLLSQTSQLLLLPHLLFH